MNKKYLLKLSKSAAGLIISLVIVIWLIKALDWNLVLLEFKKANYWYLFPVFASTMLHYYFKALRWRYLLPASDGLTLKNLFDAIMIGNLATYILPLRAGEFIRPYVLSRDSKGQISFPTSFASVVIERVFDLFAVLLTFALILPNVPSLPEWVSTGATLLTWLGIIMLSMLVWAVFSPQSINALCKIACKPLPTALAQKIQELLNDSIKGAQVLKSWKNLSINILLTIVMWIFNYAIMYYGLFLFDINQSVLLALTTAVILALAVAAPSAPGFIGIFQVATLASFVLFGESKEVATSYAIILHVFQYLLFIILGGLALGHRGMRLGRLAEDSHKG